MKTKKWEYPLRKPNIIVYRRNGNNPVKAYGYWDGGGNLEIYRTSDDNDCSWITLNMLKDEYTVWYENRKNKPNVQDYRIKILSDILCPKKLKVVVKEGEEFVGFEVRFSGVEND